MLGQYLDMTQHAIRELARTTLDEEFRSLELDEHVLIFFSCDSCKSKRNGEAMRLRNLGDRQWCIYH